MITMTLKSGHQIFKNDHGEWHFKSDADEAQFFDLELETVKKKMYEVKYAKNIFLDYFPISTEADKADDKVSYLMWDFVGIAKFIAADAEDIEVVKTYGQKRTVDLKKCASAYKYTIDDLWKAAKTGRRLDTKDAADAKKAIGKKLELVGWVGDEEFGIKGLITHPNITVSTVPVTTGNDWLTKPIMEVLEDMDEMFSTVEELTDTVYVPNAFFAPSKVLRRLRTTNISVDNASNISALRYWLDNHEEIKVVAATNRLKDVPHDVSGTTNAAVMCVIDPDVITFELPLSFWQDVPEKKGPTYKVACYAKTGGVIITHPLTVYIMQNVID